MLTIYETPTFVSDAALIWSDEERLEFFTWLSVNPLAGDVIKESGGCRKVRWARSGMGKSGGARVIYFTRLSEGEICVLVAYPKSVRATIPGPILRQIRKELESGNKVKDQTKG
jgi:hypothetical protein